MSEKKAEGIGFFQKYLTLWVAICMALGILIGKFSPQIPAFFGKFEYANVSIPIVILIWVMIYPMMMKVDFQKCQKCQQKSQRIVCYMDCKLADQAIYHVWHCKLIFLCYIQRFYHTRLSKRISCRCCTFRSCSLYCNGFCMESLNKRKSSIYRCSGCNK